MPTKGEKLELSLPERPGIYKVIDRPTGRYYIGSAVNIARRWRYHTYRFSRDDHPNPIMQAIWNADPERLFCTVCEFSDAATKESLLKMEQKWLCRARPGKNRRCMNVLARAGSHQGHIRTLFTRAKISQAHTGKRPSDEARQKMREAHTGKRLSEEHKQKIGMAVRGRPINRPKGIINYRLRRFSEVQVRQMRCDRREGCSWRELSEKYGAAIKSIRNIVNRETYRDVT